MYAALGEFALGEAPIPTIRNIYANIKVVTKSRLEGTFATTCVAKAGVHNHLRLPGGFNLPAKLHVEAKMLAPGGFNLPAKIHAETKGKWQGGFNLPARIHAEAKGRAPGGVLLATRIHAEAKVRAPGGVALPGRIYTVSHPFARWIVPMVGSVRTQLMSSSAVVGVSRVVNDTERLRLYSESANFYWPGRSNG